VAANAVWTALWIPARWRRTELRISYDLPAEPGAVFEFVTNTDNWARYREDFVRATPPGRLRVGTEIVTRQPLNWLSNPDPKLAKFVEVNSTVTAVGPGRTYSLAGVGRPRETSRIEITGASGGTQVTSVAQGSLSIAQASLGFMLEMPSLLAARRASIEKSTGRLREALEG
jgi:hypothetical protein